MRINKSSRLLVNVVGGPAIIALIVAGDSFFSIPLFSIFILLVMFIAVSEIKNLVVDHLMPLAMPIIYISIFLLQLLRYVNQHHLILPLLIILILFSMILELAMKSKYHIQNLALIVFIFAWIGIGFGSIVDIRAMGSDGLSMVLTIFFGVWVCDSAAYILGKKLGKRKIAQTISPNKTWAGSISGFIGVFLLLIIFHMYDVLSMNTILNSSFIHLIGFSVVIGIGSQIGDLVESMFKRDAGVKDTGAILMGHGGVLDRFDSLLFVVPMMWVYIKFILGYSYL